jgi:type IV fimbrial biogenesis protein FimT
MPNARLKKRPGRWPNRGFTVIDLLVTMAALAIVILVAVPSSKAAIHKHQITEAAGNLLSGLAEARTESIARSSTVTICPSSNGFTCRHDDNWDLGWLVYTDGNADGQVQEFEKLLAFEAPADKIRIRARGAVASRASFTAAGLTPTDQADSGIFLVCLSGSDVEPLVVDVGADGLTTLRPARGQTCESEDPIRLSSLGVTQ